MALQELKLLLLSKSMDRISTAEQHNTILNALQSLLKVAEMRNKCCFFDDCAHPALALQNKFSLNISLEKDRLLLQTGYGNQHNGSSHDLYGPSDGDTTDTDNSYATADEGYDVSNVVCGCACVCVFVCTSHIDKIHHTFSLTPQERNKQARPTK